MTRLLYRITKILSRSCPDNKNLKTTSLLDSKGPWTQNNDKPNEKILTQDATSRKRLFTQPRESQKDDEENQLKIGSRKAEVGGKITRRARRKKKNAGIVPQIGSQVVRRIRLEREIRSSRAFCNFLPDDCIKEFIWLLRRTPISKLRDGESIKKLKYNINQLERVLQFRRKRNCKKVMRKSFSEHAIVDEDDAVDDVVVDEKRVFMISPFYDYQVRTKPFFSLKTRFSSFLPPQKREMEVSCFLLFPGFTFFPDFCSFIPSTRTNSLRHTSRRSKDQKDNKNQI